MGDSKRKSETEKIEKVEKKESGSVGFTELRDDLFREAAKLVSEDPSTKIAILVTPPSSESDVSMHAFGYPSVEGVVQTFLEDNSPVPVPENAMEEMVDDDDDDEEDPSPQRFWWEDDKLMNSTNPEQLKAACDEMLRLRNHLRVIKRGQGSGNHEDLHKP
ncbi:hypothetical protein EUTSA_v10022424mg [Eutrema salsugineum]|uniref:MADS-box domain-containing protein n=1 Tax=Eutrema salsugineum TaxID=72664 RepID=V4LY41_EUTSA|nr:agamous-like MADS-box protein AGL97 [Eutrema salsugineum]ESQ48779.1 hypothetical protein EUTSA_v10022424mg [Eutrema salsugineum]